MGFGKNIIWYPATALGQRGTGIVLLVLNNQQAIKLITRKLIYL